jgi:hypothetical protein
MPDIGSTIIKSVTAFAAAAAFLFPTTAWSYVSIAYTQSLPDGAYARIAPTKQKAEQAALAYCRELAGKTVSKPECRIVITSDAPGFYAVVCGQMACGISVSQASLLAAQEEATAVCLQQQKYCFKEVSAWGNDAQESSAPTKAKK